MLLDPGVISYQDKSIHVEVIIKAYPYQPFAAKLIDVSHIKRKLIMMIMISFNSLLLVLTTN